MCLIGASLGFLPRAPALAVAAAAATWFFACLIPGIRVVATLPVVLVAGPIFVLQRRLRVPAVEPIADLPDDLPDPTRTAVTRCRAELESIGFRRAGLFQVGAIARNPDPAERDGMLIEGYEHPVRRQCAAILVPLMRVSPRPPPVFVRFMEWLPSDALLGIVNSEEPGMFPRDPRQPGLTAPASIGVREMYSIFQGLLHRFAPGHTPKGVGPGGWAAAVQRENEWVFGRWRSLGYVIPAGDDSEEERTPLRWACWAAWGLSPLIVDIRRWILRRRFKRLRAEWGV